MHAELVGAAAVVQPPPPSPPPPPLPLTRDLGEKESSAQDTAPQQSPLVPYSLSNATTSAAAQSVAQTVRAGEDVALAEAAIVRSAAPEHTEEEEEASAQASAVKNTISATRLRLPLPPHRSGPAQGSPPQQLTVPASPVLSYISSASSLDSSAHSPGKKYTNCALSGSGTAASFFCCGMLCWLV